jgi:Uma2 family endonuclease
MQLTQKRYYTPEEYLELEATADYKSEYIEGQIIAVVGASINHNRITGNFYATLNFAFRQQEKYEVFNSDMRLWIPQKLIYTYPNVMIIADEPEFVNNRLDTITNPQVIIEVLSKSTKSYDREDKFAAYRTIPTFQEYLLIDQNRIYVEQFSKTGKKRWNLCEYDEEDENISFETLPFEISLQDLYNKVKFPDIESLNENSNS